MYKIGIIGDRSTVAGFIALGYTVHEADDAAAAGEILRRIATGDKSAADDGYAIIFIVEKFARELMDDIKKYSGQMVPAITVLPDGNSRDGELSCGMSLIKQHVERAVGADILFRD